MRHITNMAETYRNIREKLKASDGAGAYVKDFKKSDAPQFKGKSDKKIQKMAIAAYLDDKEKNENFDIEVARATLDEKKAVITIDVKKLFIILKIFILINFLIITLSFPYMTNPTNFFSLVRPIPKLCLSSKKREIYLSIIYFPTIDFKLSGSDSIQIFCTCSE